MKKVLFDLKESDFIVYYKNNIEHNLYVKYIETKGDTDYFVFTTQKRQLLEEHFYSYVRLSNDLLFIRHDNKSEFQLQDKEPISAFKKAYREWMTESILLTKG